MSWLIDTTLWTGALIALVLVLRRPLGRLFGPGLAYALWALPLLRLVLPPIVLPALPRAAVAAPAPTVIFLPATPAAPVAATFDPRPLLLALWLGGAMALLGWRLLAYRRMRRQLLAGAHELAPCGTVRVIESPALSSPVAFGLIDRVVALPTGFAGADPAARELALAHELAHHRRRDLWANWAAQPLLALHWFNPLAWAGWRAMRRDQEAACDAAVLAGRDAPTRAAYAALIAALARAGARAPAASAALACPMLREPHVIHRLRSLTMTEISKRRRWLGRALWGAAALALPLTASVSRAQNAAVPPPPPPPPAAAELPAAPSAPAAPAAATPPVMLTAPAVGEKKIVIVQQDKHHGAGHTVTIQRGGKTYVFTTDKELSPAEVDQRIARIETEVGELPATPPVPGEPHARVIIKRRIAGGDGTTTQMIADGHDIDGTIASAMAEADTEIAHAVGEACGKDKVTTVDASGAEQSRVKLKLCHDGIRAHVAAALTKARTEIAVQNDMPADIKAKVLKALDEKIAQQH